MTDIANRELTTLAFCWQLERKDGAGVALTSHDQSLDVENVRFDPAPGIVPAAIRSELGLGASTSEIVGAMSSASISETDIVVGRWDGARLKLFAVDWQDPDTGQHPLIEGELGQVAAIDGRFEADLLGVAARLNAPACPSTSPECRAELGDRKCQVDMAGRRLRAVVVSINNHILTIDQPADDRFRFGEVRFLAGGANGQRKRILSASGPELVLRSAPIGEVAAGTPVEVIEGCDKRLESCATRFANSANFRGEPHLPGNDLLTRYPGS